jgi:hypothetical protein
VRNCGRLACVLVFGCSFDVNVSGESALGDDSSGTSSTATSSDASTTEKTTGPTTTPTTTNETTTSADATTIDPDDTGTSDASQGTEASGSTGETICPDLLWVGGDLPLDQTSDAPFYAAIMDLGYDVEVVSGLNATAEMAEGKCAVLLSSVGESTQVNTKFQGVSVPVIVWEHNLLDDMGMVLTAGNQGTVGADSIEIIDAAHPLAAGLSGVVALQGAIDQMAWGNTDVGVVATVYTIPSYAAIFYYESGDTMPSTIVAPAHRVALPFANESVTPPTKAAVDLFVAAVAWATEP